MTPEEREAEWRRQRSALNLGAPSPGVPDQQPPLVDRPVAQSSLPEMTSPETHERNREYRNAQDLSRGLGLLAAGGSIAGTIGAAASGNQAALPWISNIGSGLMKASQAPANWAREDRAFEDAERDRQAADAAAKKEAARKENEAAWERFLGQEKLRQGQQGLAIREQDLAQDRAWRQEQATLGYREDQREQANFAYAEARRDPASGESRTAQGFVRAARDSITASGRNPGMGEQLSDETIAGLSAEQIEKNDILKRLMDAGMQMNRGRRGGGGGGAGAPPTQQAGGQEDVLLQHMASEQARVKGTTVEEELALLHAERAQMERTEGGKSQWAARIRSFMERRERTNMGTDQRELEVEREAAVTGWDRDESAPAISSAEAAQIRNLVTQTEIIEAKTAELERLADQLNWSDHAIAGGTVGDLVNQFTGNPEALNKARQLSIDINGAIRRIQHMGVPQRFEMEYVTRGFPEPDTIKGGLQMRSAARNFREQARADLDAGMANYGYRRAAGGGGNPQSRQVAPTHRINRTRSSARRADATQAPATPPPETNMSPPSGGGTVRVMFEGEELEIPAEDLQDALRDGATQL